MRDIQKCKRLLIDSTISAMHIPNCLSLLNLISGTIGTVLALSGYFTYAAYAVFIGAFFDFLDGLVAKLLSAQSAMGKQLDSLADLITFGMLPAAILYRLMQTYGISTYSPYTALLIVVCSALRLAKFNVDNRQTDQFIGLPTPANATLIATLPMMLTHTTYPYLGHILPFVFPLLSLLLSWLLVSPITFIALKFKGFSFQDNRLRYGLLGIGTCLVLAMKIEGLFFSICLYIFLSLYHALTH